MDVPAKIAGKARVASSPARSPKRARKAARRIGLNIEPLPAILTVRQALAERFGARTIRATDLSPDDVVAQVRAMTNGRGVDVALELVGNPDTMRTALQSLAPLGRAVVVGLSDINLPVDTYRDLIGREAELIGSNDHLLSELYELVEMADKGILNLADVVMHTVPLQAQDINGVLDALDRHAAPIRTVIVP